MEIGNIKFSEIVKLIHPDINPNIKDPADKMGRILMYRDEPSTLYRLAKEWDLIVVNNGVVSAHSAKQKPVKSTNTFKRPSPKRTSTVIGIGSRILVKTIGRIVTVTKISPKRYYFSINGKVSYCAKKNAILV